MEAFCQHLRAALICTDILSTKITKPNCNYKKLQKKISYEKAARKILVKLTPYQIRPFGHKEPFRCKIGLFLNLSDPMDIDA